MTAFLLLRENTHTQKWFFFLFCFLLHKRIKVLKVLHSLKEQNRKKQSLTFWKKNNVFAHLFADEKLA